MASRSTSKSKPRAPAIPLRELKIVMVPVGRLKPAPWNPRLITPKRQQNLKAGLAEFGMVEAIIARKEDGLVVGGHQRLELLKAAGQKKAPVVYVQGLSLARAKALNVLLNNEEAQGQMDPGALAALLREVQAAGAGKGTGFDEAALARLLAAAQPESPPDFEVVPGQVTTSYKCPNCSYEWSGKPKGAAKQAGAAARK
jgi:hypothetical protein